MSGDCARVIRGVGGLYTLLTAEGESLLARPRGIFRKKSLEILPGDRVAVAPSGDVDVPWRIERLLPRRNVLLRPPMANLEALILVQAVAEPEPDWLWLDTMLAYCAHSGIKAYILWNKLDRLDEGAPRSASEAEWAHYRACGFTVLTGDWRGCADALARLRAFVEAELRGLVWAFAGPSGAGKSSLTNLLLGEARMETGHVSEKLRRGRHTTRHVELIPFLGGFMCDTPGFSALEVQALALTQADLDAAFPEIISLSADCRFQDCRHRREPDCAVRLAAAGEDARARRARRYGILAERIELATQLRKEGKCV